MNKNMENVNPLLHCLAIKQPSSDKTFKQTAGQQSGPAYIYIYINALVCVDML